MERAQVYSSAGRCSVLLALLGDIGCLFPVYVLDALGVYSLLLGLLSFAIGLHACFMPVTSYFYYDHSGVWFEVKFYDFSSRVFPYFGCLAVCCILCIHMNVCIFPFSSLKNGIGIFLFLKLGVLVDIYLHADLFSMWPPICNPEKLKALDPLELGL